MNIRILKCGAAALALSAGSILAPAANAQSSASVGTTGYRYDAQQRLVGTIAPDPDGTGPLRYAATRNTYDAAGRLTRVETGELSQWQSEDVAPASWSGFTVFQAIDSVYDAMGRKLRTTLSGREPATGQLVAQSLTQMNYDALGRVECAAVRMNPAAFGSLPASACTLGSPGSFGPDRIVKNSYDAVGQLTKVTEGYGTADQADEVAKSYTPNGKLATLTDAESNTTTYEYDGHDRLARLRFPVATKGAATSSTSDYEEYGLDASGNRISLRKRDGQVIAFGYDALNRVIAKDAPGSAADVAYTYDLRGLQTGATFTATGHGVTGGFDNLGRLVSSSTSMGGVTRTMGSQFDADGHRTRVTHPDGTSFTYDYDGLDRVTVIRENGAASLASFIYDAQGRRTSLTYANGAVVGYSYDPASRLTQLSHDLAGTASDLNLGFSYNPASQIISGTRSNDAYASLGQANASSGYAANGLNQYVTAAGATLAYDANGNLTSDGATTFAYDVDNRLVSASGAKNAALTYDPAGRLFRITGNGADNQFLYDGDELVAEFDGAGSLTRRYVHGSSADDPLATYEGGQRRFLHTDQQGSVLTASDGSANASTINRYDEYGVPAATNLGRFQYTGQSWMPELGLYHYKARVYSATLGRFLQTDPIGYNDQFNLYSYVTNDPINKNDPAGMFAATSCDPDARGNVSSSCSGGSVLDAVDTFRARLATGGAAVGALLGAYAGGTAGGTGGAFAGLGCGPAAVACSPAGALAGAAAGTTVGAAGGLVVGGATGAAVGAIIDKGIILFNKITGHGEQRSAEARGGDRNRQVGDPNRVVREGRQFRDTETGATIYVKGDRVVAVGENGRITQFRNPSSNTQSRIQSGKWEPK